MGVVDDYVEGQENHDDDDDDDAEGWVEDRVHARDASFYRCPPAIRLFRPFAAPADVSSSTSSPPPP